MTFKVAAWALALLALAVLAASVWLAIGRNLDFAWTSIRLAPAFALAKGEALYSVPDRLPWVMVGYGPLYPVAYLPCVFARHPVTAVSAATLLAHFYILAPVAALCSLGARRLQANNAGRPLHWIFTFLLFALITTIAPSLAVALFSRVEPPVVVIAAGRDAEVDAAAVLKVLTAQFGGKGGGKRELAQGGGFDAPIDQLRAAARAALRQ